MNLILKDNYCTPRFYSAYQLPYVIRSEVENELRRLEDNNIISKVERSEWTLPIVVDPKINGQIRICVDLKVTLDLCLKVD